MSFSDRSQVWVWFKLQLSVDKRYFTSIHFFADM